MLVADGDDAQEEEDNAVGQCSHGLDGILDSCVTLLGNVEEGVALLCYAASNLQCLYGVCHTL